MFINFSTAKMTTKLKTHKIPRGYSLKIIHGLRWLPTINLRLYHKRNMLNIPDCLLSIRFFSVVRKIEVEFKIILMKLKVHLFDAKKTFGKEEITSVLLNFTKKDAQFTSQCEKCSSNGC